MAKVKILNNNKKNLQVCQIPAENEKRAFFSLSLFNKCSRFPGRSTMTHWIQALNVCLYSNKYSPTPQKRLKYFCMTVVTISLYWIIGSLNIILNNLLSTPWHGHEKLSDTDQPVF